MRLNKFIAHAGVYSRRKADELIAAGKVTVNGEVVREMGHRVKPGDEVHYRGKLLQGRRKVYVLLNKPKGFITTTHDERGRRTVLELVRRATPERLYPVGRLDRNTTGLLLMTNDGELAERLTHPRYEIKKVYSAELDKPITKADLEKIAAGLELEDGPITVDEVALPDPSDRRKVGLALHSGRNRIVRRLFESLGYEVTKLDRGRFCRPYEKGIAPRKVAPHERTRSGTAQAALRRPIRSSKLSCPSVRFNVFAP